ncbi:MAG: radical SAM protein [Spirochaetaceae bacterium]|jgi:hypothetical protein|nr:radical SAM protein [Spirochaetaceae bacterium]
MDSLNIDIGVIIINNICTLKCKKCITLTPYQKRPINFDVADIKNDIDGFFEIFEKCNHFDIEGGETLLHPDITEIVSHSLKYSDRFKYTAILTNGTIVPKKELLEFCKDKPVFFIIDDYGEKLSIKKSEVIESLKEYNLNYRIDTYHSDNQYCGGWIDMGDFSYKNYSKEQLMSNFKRCRATQGIPYIKEGKIFSCTIAAPGISHIPLLPGEYIDLRDKNQTISEKIETAKNFYKKPIAHCAFCNAFIISSPRIAAAEQFKTGELTDDMKICD